jgi:hypothetical protein
MIAIVAVREVSSRIRIMTGFVMRMMYVPVLMIR